ncbi:hypothetical protein GOP47_0019597 [Adiantum capillus-veneris]|uniref:Transcription factor CBF/NF-Y/archaeal histone domain-containing protein n=1 Tax=Adiantum capillus-veneris TaxID=13818 RepID=A0A9D4UC37_ADICA|nr:hypothetical protein GOP47_0019597 [Adiantum capillus-veneris]
MAEHPHRQNSPESGHQSDEESGGHYGGGHDSVREQDRLLPIANVSRIMKKALPANAKISKEAKETVQECVSEFISFITGEASDKCQREKRKTVNGDDLLWAMGTLGFEDYLEPLKAYLLKYREIEGERVSMAKQSEQNMNKESGAMSGSPAGLMGVNGVINGGGMPGSVVALVAPLAVVGQCGEPKDALSFNNWTSWRDERGRRWRGGIRLAVRLYANTALSAPGQTCCVSLSAGSRQGPLSSSCATYRSRPAASGKISDYGQNLTVLDSDNAFSCASYCT